MGPDINDVNELAGTVLGAPVVVLLAVVIVIMGIGIVALLWYFSRAFSKQSDSQIEQIKLFNSALSDTGNMNTQLLTANMQNVKTLDRIGDNLVLNTDILQQQQVFCNTTLSLLQTQNTTIEAAIEVNQEQHGKMEVQVSDMQMQMSEIVTAIKELQVQMGILRRKVDAICTSDSENEKILTAVLNELSELNKMVNVLVQAVTDQTEEPPE